MVLEEAFRNEVNIWMVTDADEVSTLTDCNQLRILQNCNQPFNVKGTDEREVEVAIKTHLRQLVERKHNLQGISSETKRSNPKSSHERRRRRTKKNDQVSQQMKDVVFFKGSSLRYILKDETIKKTFLLLCSMCSYMIGSEVTA